MGFRKGEGGRPAGAKNRVPQRLKEAVLYAAESIGRDGKGTDGLNGFMIRMAKRHPRDFNHILGRLLPIEIKADLRAKLTTDAILAALHGSAPPKPALDRSAPLLEHQDQEDDS